MNNQFCLITTACDDIKIAEKIRAQLLEKRLVSCVQFIPINSSYYWKGKIENSDEILLHIKTKKELYPEVQEEILKCHNYELPEIVAYDFCDGYMPFFNWIEKETK